jgi:hypothetical protein
MDTSISTVAPSAVAHRAADTSMEARGRTGMADRIYNKTKVRRWATLPNRWGGGVVHLYVYARVVTQTPWMRATPRKHKDGKYYAWQQACAREQSHGEEITDRDDPTPVTCKRCLSRAAAFVPPDWMPKEVT